MSKSRLLDWISNSFCETQVQMGIGNCMVTANMILGLVEASSVQSWMLWGLSCKLKVVFSMLDTHCRSLHPNIGWFDGKYAEYWILSCSCSIKWRTIEVQSSDEGPSRLLQDSIVKPRDMNFQSGYPISHLALAWYWPRQLLGIFPPLINQNSCFSPRADLQLPFWPCWITPHCFLVAIRFVFSV